MRKLLLAFSVVFFVAFGAYLSRVVVHRSLPRSGLLIVLAPGTYMRPGSTLTVRVNGAVVTKISDLYERRRKHVGLPPQKHLTIVIDQRTDFDEDGVEERLLSRFWITQAPQGTLCLVRMAEIPRMVVYGEKSLAGIRQVRADIGPPDYGIMVENSSKKMIRRVEIEHPGGTLVETNVCPDSRDRRYNAIDMRGVDSVRLTFDYGRAHRRTVNFGGLSRQPQSTWWPRRWHVQVVDDKGTLLR